MDGFFRIWILVSFFGYWWFFWIRIWFASLDLGLYWFCWTWIILLFFKGLDGLFQDLDLLVSFGYRIVIVSDTKMLKFGAVWKLIRQTDGSTRRTEELPDEGNLWGILALSR